MKTSIAIALGLALSVPLAGCDKQSEAPKAPENASVPADDEGTMATPVDTRHGKGTGTVTAIERAKGRVTLAHDAIAELAWPAMTMDFAANPDMLKDIKVGDKIAFELDWDGKAGTITQIGKAP